MPAAIARFVLLDLYETLAWVDWPKLHVGRSRIAAQLGVAADAYQAAWNETLPDRQLGRLGGRAGDVAAVLGIVGVDASPSRVDEITVGEELLWRDAVSLFDDVVRCLTEFRALGMRLALVSNCSYQTRAVVDGWRLGSYLDAIVLSCELGFTKPDPAIYLYALKRLGGRPEEALLVDDNVDFLDAAARLGVQTRLMRRASPPSTEAHRGIAQLSDLLDRLNAPGS